MRSWGIGFHVLGGGGDAHYFRLPLERLFLPCLLFTCLNLSVLVYIVFRLFCHLYLCDNCPVEQSELEKKQSGSNLRKKYSLICFLLSVLPNSACYCGNYSLCITTPLIGLSCYPVENTMPFCSSNRTHPASFVILPVH